MSHLTVRIFGQATILVNGLKLVWPTDSARTLLFYLLCHPNGQPYETIIQALWTPKAGYKLLTDGRLPALRGSGTPR